MKHYVDIERVRFEDEGLTKTNTGAFEVGDHIQISEKIDGANASIAYEDGKLKAFSRKNELNMSNNLRGFWNWVQTLDADKFADLGKRICFGEFLVRHTIAYNQDAYNQFYVFDMYDTETEEWLQQTEVKEFAENHGLNYVHVLYDGPFVSWEHCMSFLHSPAYGDNQEGIVVKNESKLNDKSNRLPVYLKIVNAQFKETQLKNHVKKVLDPNDIEERKLADEHANELVTVARVKKEIGKMIDEGILPEEILPTHMGIIAKNLSQRIYNDIDKEDHDTLMGYMSKYLGKAISTVAMNHAKRIVLGG